MSQNVVNYSDNPTGPELLDNYLAKDQENCVTSNSGIQRPSYAVAGTVWLDNSTTPWTWYFYDGTSDIAIGTFNASTHEFTSANFANVVNLTTAQTVAGLKTFTDKPRVPTPTSTDDVATVINIAYLNGIVTGLNSVIDAKAGLTSNNNFTGSNTFVTQALSDDSNKPATTAWIKDLIVEVNALPANPDSNVWYAIPEEE